jgi:hypothetical protein
VDVKKERNKEMLASIFWRPRSFVFRSALERASWRSESSSAAEVVARLSLVSAPADLGSN